MYGLRYRSEINSAINTTSVSQKYGTGILAEEARIQRKVTVKKVKVAKLYEDTVPVGRIAIVKEPVASATKYGTPTYGDGTLYGGLPSFVINRIRYSLTNSGAFNANFSLGQPRPNVATEIKKLQFEIESVKNQ